MKAVVAAILISALLGACSYREEKTTVARPAPAGAVVTQGATSTTTTVGIN